MFYVSDIPPFLSRAVFLTFVIFWSLNSPEWIPDIALCVLKSLLLLFSFKMRLLYLSSKVFATCYICRGKSRTNRLKKKRPALQEIDPNIGPPSARRRATSTS